jgi:uncharacterized protein (TIGR02466 family)
MNITNYNLFPSLVSHIECDNFSSIQNDLLNWIYLYQKDTDSVILSNRGGWQSPSNFYVNNSSFNRFYDYIAYHINESIKIYKTEFNLLNMWININRKGDYNTLHDHPVSHLSGAIWIKTPERGGNFVFHNSHSFSQYCLLESVSDEVRDATNYASSFRFQAKEGCMLIFPSDLMHLVEKNESDEDRVSISFNLGVK